MMRRRQREMAVMGLPLAGFAGKLLLFTAAWEAGLAWLVVLILANSLIFLYWCLRVIGPMLLSSAEVRFGAGREGPAVAGLGMGLTILAGVEACWPQG